MAKTILVIDDEAIVRDISSRKLQEEGFGVIAVGDGEEALRVLREGPVDLIILDIEMPNLNGYNFLSERLKIPGANQAPVIVLTAYNTMEPIFRRHGISAYLTKPIKFQDLLAKIKKVLEETSGP